MDKASRPVRNRRHSRRAWPPGEPHHPSHRLQKRLFTPEIKRMLKDWLVRRRENPYPSRDEKKRLAISSGLTYIQICNWFANWRRKLKNAGREPAKKTWGHLIKTYNVSANGNVEQFSICSEDSIWGDDERPPFDIGTYSDQTVLTDQPVGYEVRHDQPHILGFYDPRAEGTVNKLGASYELPNQPPRDAFDGYFSASVFESESNVCSKPIGHYATTINHPANAYYMLPETQEQCFQISSTTHNYHQNSIRSSEDSSNSPNSSASVTSVLPPTSSKDALVKPAKSAFATNAKYKNNIMEKYLRDLEPANLPHMTTADKDNINQNSFSLERITYSSAAETNNTMKPVGGMELSKWLESAANFTPKKNNYIEWETRNKTNQDKHTSTASGQYAVNHEREDLEAAEVLTSLAGNYRSRMFGIATKSGGTN